jgi:Phage stabilisation protein
MPKTGLVGGSYTTQSIIADSSRTINWYPEQIESNRGISGAALYPTPGLSLFSTVGTGPMRGSAFLDGRLYTVSGNKLYEIAVNGSIVGSAEIGTMDSDSKQCQIAQNPSQVLILSGGKGYILSAGALNIIADVDFPGNLPNTRAIKCGYVDGYFFVLADNNFFYISALNDGTLWDQIDSSRLEFSSNRLQTMIIDHREVFVFGNEIGQVLYNSGDPDFPFTTVPQGSIEFGATPDSPAKMDNSVFILSQDQRGAGMVMRLQGYTPQRVSDHGIEYNLQRKIHAGIDLNAAVSWTYQADGHSFYVLNIPGIETSPVYDAATKLWHERAWWDAAHGQYAPIRAINHVYAFNKHIVGDRETGLLYDMDIETYTDNGTMIRRLRRHPHIQAEGKRVKHQRLQLQMETGVGLAVASDQPGYDPQIALQYSDDGGKNYVDEMPTSIGKLGETFTDVEWRDMGSTEVSRVYQYIASDPVPYRLFESILDISGVN